MNRRLLGIFILALFVLLLWFVSVRQSLLFLLGIGMGSVLAGARFGFTTGWRRLIEERDGSGVMAQDRKSTRLNSSHVAISYAVFCLKKKTTEAFCCAWRAM